MTQWERAVEAAAKAITQTEAERPGATAGELAAAALRVALPVLFAPHESNSFPHVGSQVMAAHVRELDAHRRALEAEASHEWVRDR